MENGRSLSDLYLHVFNLHYMHDVLTAVHLFVGRITEKDLWVDFCEILRLCTSLNREEWI